MRKFILMYGCVCKLVKIVYTVIPEYFGKKRKSFDLKYGYKYAKSVPLVYMFLTCRIILIYNLQDYIEKSGVPRHRRMGTEFWIRRWSKGVIGGYYVIFVLVTMTGFEKKNSIGLPPIVVLLYWLWYRSDRILNWRPFWIKATKLTRVAFFSKNK